MSADNYVTIKEMDGMWHVWMVLGGYEKEDWDVPGGHYHKFFEEELNAHHYAHQICATTVVEYGVVLQGVAR